MLEVTFKLRVPFRQQVFTHVDNEVGKARTFLIETMQNFIEDYPWCPMLQYGLAPVTKEIADYLRTNAGIEQHRIDRLDDPYLSVPIIGILWSDSDTTIVDGNHRMVKRFEQGHKSIEAILFKYPFWENFLLPDEASKRLVADGFLTKESNIV